METQTELGEHEAARQPMPGTVRGVLFATIAVALAGALYLVAVRGEALLLDLSAFSQRVFCF
jgi:hypothetical protein